MRLVSVLRDRRRELRAGRAGQTVWWEEVAAAGAAGRCSGAQAILWRGEKKRWSGR